MVDAFVYSETVNSRESRRTLARPSKHRWGGLLEQDEALCGRVILSCDGVEVASAREIVCLEHFFVVPMPLLSINK